MSINRHNYEEYFILYLDNELGSDERRMVDQFVQQHPDLKEELELLMQYKLTPDESVTYPVKEELLKINGITPVTLSNYDEWLVLYTDNELNPSQKELVDHFVAAHPAVQKELELLQKTKLQPETIVFPHKESLYRREEKVVRMPIRWWRAAAAVLVLAFGLSAVLILNRKQTIAKEEVATARPDQQKQPLKSVPAGNDNSTAPGPVEQPESPVLSEIATSNNKVPDNPAINPGKNAIVAKQIIKAPENKLPLIIPSEIKKEETVAANHSNNLPQPLDNPNIKRVSPPTDAVVSVQSPQKTDPEYGTTPAVTKTGAVPSDIITAGNNGETIEQPEGKKNKNRGIFRKIARTFEKRTNIDPTTDDNRLLVAGLSIKLK